MGSNRLAIAIVGFACVVAAAGGSYLATRHNVTSLAVPTASADAVAPAASTPAASAMPTASAVPPDVATQQAEAAIIKAPRPQRLAAEPAKAAASASAPAPTSSIQSSGRAVSPPPTVAQADDIHSQDPVASAPPPADVLPATPADADRPIELPKAPEPPARAFQELVVSAESVIGLQTEGLISSERARVEDRVEARVVRDVRVGGEVAIPAGTRALGTVVVVERGGKVRQAARLGIRFETLQMADGTRMPITTETIFRTGDAPGNGSAAKIGGGAVAGAILGAIIGGGKGAAIGASTGAGAGAAAVMGGDRSAATFPPGSEVTARILSPITVTIERE